MRRAHIIAIQCHKFFLAKQQFAIMPVRRHKSVTRLAYNDAVQKAADWRTGPDLKRRVTTTTPRKKNVMQTGQL
jgi:hypothetical protein